MLDVTVLLIGAKSSVAVLGYAPAIDAGVLMISGIPVATTLFVAATATTSGVDAGPPTMYGISPSLPAEMTLTTPKFTTSVNISLSSSSRMPNEPPIDMLITSTALLSVPELVG